MRFPGFDGGVPERSKGSDCKSDGSAFEGSNPSPSTSTKRGTGSVELHQSCGCSSVVEQKPSKLTTRVRFPSPAPVENDRPLISGCRIRGIERIGWYRSSGAVKKMQGQ